MWAARRTTRCLISRKSRAVIASRGSCFSTRLRNLARRLPGALLNVLDSGRLELSAGTKRLNFNNCLIFMTSNEGARELDGYRRKFEARLEEMVAPPTVQRSGAGDSQRRLAAEIRLRVHQPDRPDRVFRGAGPAFSRRCSIRGAGVAEQASLQTQRVRPARCRGTPALDRRARFTVRSTSSAAENPRPSGAGTGPGVQHRARVRDFCR